MPRNPPDTYRGQLQHVAEPSTPKERRDADFARIRDWRALYFAEQLREWGAYHGTKVHSNIALAYADYINEQVRERGESFVCLYAHTDDAKFVLMKCAHVLKQDASPTTISLKKQVAKAIESEFPDYGQGFGETDETENEGGEN
jgi:hypothetical protein